MTGPFLPLCRGQLADSLQVLTPERLRRSVRAPALSLAVRHALYESSIRASTRCIVAIAGLAVGTVMASPETLTRESPHAGVSPSPAGDYGAHFVRNRIDADVFDLPLIGASDVNGDDIDALFAGAIGIDLDEREDTRRDWDDYWRTAGLAPALREVGP